MPADKDQLHALLADYVEGSLSEQQIDEAEAYLAANPAVRSVVDKLMIDSEALRALPPVRSPVDYSEEIKQVAERDLLIGEGSTSGAPRRPLSGPMFALAAMLIVGLGLGGAAYWVLAHRPTTGFDYAANTVAKPKATSAPADAEDLFVAAAKPESAMPTRDDAVAAEIAPGTEMTKSARGEAVAGVAPPAEAKHDPMTMAAAAPAGPAPAAMARSSASAADGRMTRRQSGDAVGGGVWPPVPEPIVAQAAATPTPAAVQAIVDAAPGEGGRRALAIVVDDVSAPDAVRRVVRDNVGLEQQSNNVYEKISNANVLAATLPIDVGPLVASDVPPAMATRLRTALADAATLYDVTPTRPADDASRGREAMRAEQRQQQMQEMQQVSGAMFPRAATPTTTPANVDVFVVVLPAAPATTTTTTTAPTE